jgi:hypothetical protein
MRIKTGILAAGLLFSTPVFAQTYNGFVTQPSYDYSTSTMAWSYDSSGSSRSATQVLTQLRARCSSDNHYDQYYCRRGMKVLNKAYAEYKLRKAAESTFAD